MQKFRGVNPKHYESTGIWYKEENYAAAMLQAAFIEISAM